MTRRSVNAVSWPHWSSLTRMKVLPAGMSWLISSPMRIGTKSATPLESLAVSGEGVDGPKIETFQNRVQFPNVIVSFHKPSPVAAHPRPHFRVFHQIIQPLGQCVNVAFRDQKTGPARQYPFRQRAVYRCDNRQTHSLRFLQDQPLAFTVAFDIHAGQNKNVGLGHDAL